MATKTVAAAETVKAFYPPGAGDGHVDFPTALVTKEREPLRNPLLRFEYESMGAAGPLRAEPAAVQFAGLDDIAGPLTQSLRLVNASGAPVRMHIMPPQTPHFTMGFANGGDGGKRGRLMPGLAEELLIKCHPDGLRYYRDTIRVHIDGGATMIVPIHAYPAVSEASFPPLIDFGRVMQGQSSQRILPLRSSTGAEFEFRVDVLTPHPDFTIEPLAGTVPANGEAAIVLGFTPSRLATARCELEVAIAQLGLAPRKITLVGSSSAGTVKRATLARLRADRAAGIGPSPIPLAAPWEEAAGGDGGDAAADPAEDPAAQAPLGVDVGDGDAVDTYPLHATLPPVLVEPPPRELLEAIAAQPLGGGSGGGDAVTRAMAIERRERLGGATVDVKYPVERPEMPSVATDEGRGMKDGLRVPWTLDDQHNVNYLLTQQRNKMRISDLRAAIEKQQAAAEAQQEELEAAEMASLSIDAQLLASFTTRVHALVKHLQDADVTGAGVVTREAFVGARRLLKVRGATDEDVADLFDQKIDHQRLGRVDYSHLERVARRNAKVDGGGGGASSSKPASQREPAELDQALQGPERSRQLKELIWSREVAAIDDYEKQKEVKSFVAIGQPVVPDDVVEATVAARAKHADGAERRARQEAGGRAATEALAERVVVTEGAVAEAASASPTFDIYLNETWGKRAAVLLQVQQGVRVEAVRARVDRRVAALHAALAKAGVAPGDKAAVRKYVQSRSKGAGVGGARAGGGAGSAAAEEEEGGLGLSAKGLAPFTFPSPPPKDATAGEDPIAVAPLAPFDETKLFALRVPRRHIQMAYQPVGLTAPGAFPPVEATRPLRVGAPFESGVPLPVGTDEPVPMTWGLPQSLVAPPPPPLTPVAFQAQLAATKALVDVGDAAEEEGGAEEGGAEEGGAADGSGAADAAGEEVAVLPRLMPKVMSRPPPMTELDVRQMLRPMPLACNEYWRLEPIGWGGAVSLLHAPSLSSKWRGAGEPWADALVTLPPVMDAVVPKDVAEDLSEDESDTEVDPSLLFPPSMDRLREIFDLPPPPADAAPADVSGLDGGADGGAPPPEGGDADAAAVAPATPAAAAAAAVDEGDVAIAPERSMAVDSLSECARAEAALGEAAAVARREQRLRLRERFASLNELIDEPRYQLTLS